MNYETNYQKNYLKNDPIKATVINGLIQLVKSAPYVQSSKNYDVPAQEFDLWINYVNSVLDISFENIRLNIILLTKIEIMQLSVQNQISYKQRIDQIKSVILNLAQQILKY